MDENSSIPAENVYVQDDDVEAGSVWKVTESMKLENVNYYLQSVANYKFHYGYELYVRDIESSQSSVSDNGSWSYGNNGLIY